MKLIKIFALVILIISTNIFTQERNNKDRVGTIPITPKQLTDEEQFKVIIDLILQYYGKNFEYYDNLINRDYEFSKSSNSKIYYLNIYKKELKIDKIEKKHRNKAFLQSIPFYKTKRINGNYDISLNRKEIEKYVNRLNSDRISPISHYIDNFIINDNILIDTMILYHEELKPEYWKILNKDFTLEFLDDQNGDDAVLFKQPEAGVILPYNNGLQSKVVITDNKFHSNLFFDSDVFNYPNEPINGYYGTYGVSHGKYLYPTGITVGRKVVLGNVVNYPIYFVNNGGFRIVTANFVINENVPALSQFDNNSYRVITEAYLPYDISYYEHLEDSTQDKIWVSESNLNKPWLSCFTNSGMRVQRFKGYIDANTNQAYLFQQGTKSRIKVYNQYFGAISFIDNIRNCLVSCQLNNDGTARYVEYEDGFLIKAHDILNFPNSENINSVSFQMVSSANSGWPYLWVTSTNMIHCLKMNSNAHVQYLASTSKPLNTDLEFHDLNNVVVTNGLFEILTMEKWSNEYGFRKYLPFVSIYRDSVTSYCIDSTDIIRMYGTFTNDCHLYVTAKRKKHDNTWESVRIKKFNGQEINEYFATKFQLAGQNQASNDLYNDLVLDLPIQDYVLNGQVKITFNMFPEYNVFDFQGRYVTREYIANVNRTCLPKPGGCPFLYVKDENNDFTPDNNILHKMEFSEPDINITDRYKLRITPNISNGAAELYLVENENNFAYIDQVKVYAVDYPKDKKMGVTEDNKIVIFDSVSVIASDSVMLNNSNITSNINYFNPSSNLTNGFVGDSLFAHFSYPDKNNIKKYIQNSEIKSQSSSKEQRAKSIERSEILRIESTKNGPNSDLPIAFITNLRNLSNLIPSIKDTAGLLTATSIYSNTVSKIFARREMESIVILPLFNDTDRVDHFNINWQSNFRMKYLGIANLNYSNYSMTEMPIIKGSSITISTDSAITTALTSVDGNYGEVNSSALIKMTFDVTQLPILPLGYKREYVIDVTGNYINGENNISSKIIQNIPLTYSLSQNYPNPFNPITKINYELPKNNQVTLVIYDILGREVIKLVNNEFKHAGRYTVEFDGKNFASGVYFYRIEAGTFMQSKKMVLIK